MFSDSIRGFFSVTNYSAYQQTPLLYNYIERSKDHGNPPYLCNCVKYIPTLPRAVSFSLLR